MDKTELNMLTALKSVPLLIVLIQANYTTQLIIIVPSTCHVLVSGTVHNALYGLLHQILIITLRDRSTVSIALIDEQRETNLQAHVPSSVANSGSAVGHEIPECRFSMVTPLSQWLK